jgi:hypothetical protein
VEVNDIQISGDKKGDWIFLKEEECPYHGHGSSIT